MNNTKGAVGAAAKGWGTPTAIAGAVLILLGILIRIVFIFDLAQYPFLLVPHGWQPDYSAFDNSGLNLADRGRKALGLPAVERKHPRARYMGIWPEPREEGEVIRGKEYINHPDEPPARPPLYVYFLGTLYFAFGDNQVLIHLAQTILGLFNAWLAYTLARRLCGSRPALFALAIGTLYWPLIIYENVHHDKTLVSFFLLLMGHGALRWTENRSLPNAAALGMLLGVTLYGAPALLLLVPVLPLWMAWVLFRRTYPGKIPIRRILYATGIMLMVLCAVLMPLILRNYHASGRLSLALGFGATLWHTAIHLVSGEDINELIFVDGPYWDDSPADLEAMGRYDTHWDATEGESRLGRMTLAHLVSNPVPLIRHCLTSAVLFWAPKENQSLSTHFVFEYALRLLSPTLDKLPGNFTLVFISFVLGLGFLSLLHLRRGSESEAYTGLGKGISPDSAVETLIFLVLVTAVWYAPYIVFGNKALYRIPIIPVLSIVGAFGIARAVVYARLRRWREFAMGAVPAAVLLPIMLVVPISYEQDVLGWLRLNVQQWEERNNSAASISVAKRIAESRPNFAEFQNETAIILLTEGKEAEALHYYLRALNAFLPDDTERLAHVANQVRRLLLKINGQEEVDPQTIKYHALVAIAKSLTDSGAYERAKAFLEAANKLQPDHNASFYYALGLVYEAEGQHDRATATLVEGIGRFPKDIELRLGLSDFQVRQGKTTEACLGYGKVLELAPDNDHALHAVATLCPPDARTSS